MCEKRKRLPGPVQFSLFLTLFYLIMTMHMGRELRRFAVTAGFEHNLEDVAGLCWWGWMILGGMCAGLLGTASHLSADQLRHQGRRALTGAALAIVFCTLAAHSGFQFFADTSLWVRSIAVFVACCLVFAPAMAALHGKREQKSAPETTRPPAPSQH